MPLSIVPGEDTVDPMIELVAGSVLDRSPKGIAAAVHRLIRAGKLEKGDRLPTVRDLAKELRVSPATVSEAWQALGAVGAIRARGRAGTFVQDTVEALLGGIGRIGDRRDVPLSEQRAGRLGN